MPTFYSNTPQGVYDDLTDPFRIWSLKSPQGKLNMINHTGVEALIITFEGKLMPLFLPTRTTTVTGESVLLGFLGENPENAILILIHETELLKHVYTYMENDAAVKFKAPAIVRMTEDLGQADRNELQHIKEPVAVVMPRWTVLLKGHTADTYKTHHLPFDRNPFTAYGDTSFAWGIYLAKRIQDSMLDTPRKFDEAYRPNLPEDLIITRELNIASQFVLGAGGILSQDTMDMMNAKKRKFMMPYEQPIIQETDTSIFADPPRGISFDLNTPPTSPPRRHSRGQSNRHSLDSQSVATMETNEDSRTLQWQLLLCTINNDELSISPVTTSHNKLRQTPTSSQPQLLSMMAQSIHKRYCKTGNLILALFSSPPFNPKFTKYLLACLFKRSDSLESGLTMDNFKQPDHESTAYISAYDDINQLHDEELVEEDSRKRKSKTGEIYGDGLANSLEDVKALIANFLGICEIFIAYKAHPKRGPKPLFLNLLFQYGLLMDEYPTKRWFAKAKKMHYTNIIPEIIRKLNQSLMRWKVACSDLDLLMQLEERGPSVVDCDALLEAHEINLDTLRELKRNILQETYSSLNLITRYSNASDRPRENKRNKSYKNDTEQEKKPAGSDTAKGIFESLIANHKPWIELGDSCNWCKNFVFVGRTCPTATKDCKWEHKRVFDMSEDDFKLFPDSWLTKNKLKWSQSAQKKKNYLDNRRNKDSRNSNNAAAAAASAQNTTANSAPANNTNDGATGNNSTTTNTDNTN